MDTNLKYIFLFFALLSKMAAYSQMELKYPVNYISSIKSYDLTKLWCADSVQTDGNGKMTPFPEPVGYIGDNHQRFYIHYTTVTKSRENPYKYNVTGKTRIKNNVCSFKGTITVVEAILYKQGYDPHYKQGQLVCSILFYEDTPSASSGVIKGKLTTSFYIDQKGQISYDALRFQSDDFKNNQCIATWTSYKTNGSKKCNWGDYQIPPFDNSSQSKKAKSVPMRKQWWK